MNNKPKPDITPNLAISAYHVLQQYCTGQPVAEYNEWIDGQKSLKSVKYMYHLPVQKEK